MMDRIFNMDNKFFTFMGKAADLILLNIIFLICCLPVVTIGASEIGRASCRERV